MAHNDTGGICAMAPHLKHRLIKGSRLLRPLPTPPGIYAYARH